MALFEDWLSSDGLRFDLKQLAATPILLSDLLAQFGRSLYREGKPYYLYVECIDRLVDFFRFLKGQLTAAWDVAGTWTDLMPPEHWPPMPWLILRAMVVVALHWNWMRFAGVLLLGFSCILRPIDVFNARAKDLLLPEHTSARVNTERGPGFQQFSNGEPIKIHHRTFWLCRCAYCDSHNC